MSESNTDIETMTFEEIFTHLKGRCSTLIIAARMTADDSIYVDNRGISMEEAGLLVALKMKCDATMLEWMNTCEEVDDEEE